MRADPSGSAGSPRAALRELLDAEFRRPRPAADFWTARLRERPGVLAGLFYGSGLWRETEPDDAVLDFYLLVDRYRHFDGRRLAALGGRVLPPNVYYEEAESGGRIHRCKYAVMRLDQFLRAGRGASFSPHIWARLCQPAALPFCRDETVRAAIVETAVEAVLVFHRRALARLGDGGDRSIEALWTAGLRSTYADELRSEPASRMGEIFRASEEAFRQRTEAALPLLGHTLGAGAIRPLPGPPSAGRGNRLHRLAIGVLRGPRKMVVLARFAKAAFTFENGLDYARWKIGRHSGRSVEISDFQRRHPLLGGFSLGLRLLRRRMLR